MTPISEKQAQACVKCILNFCDDPDLRVDEKGICNHCHNYNKLTAEFNCTNEERQRKLNEIVSTIKSDGIGKKYDCVLGISGGVDSTYLAVI